MLRRLKLASVCTTASSRARGKSEPPRKTVSSSARMNQIVAKTIGYMRMPKRTLRFVGKAEMRCPIAEAGTIAAKTASAPLAQATAANATATPPKESEYMIALPFQPVPLQASSDSSVSTKLAKLDAIELLSGPLRTAFSTCVRPRADPTLPCQ